MTTAARHQQSGQNSQGQGQATEPHIAFDATTYDPDEAIPHGSPLMKQQRPRLAPTPSPPPDIPRSQIVDAPGDSVLISYLDNGRHPDIARAAGALHLPYDEADQDGDDDDDEAPCFAPCNTRQQAGFIKPVDPPMSPERGLCQTVAWAPSEPMNGSSNLQDLAAGALKAFGRGSASARSSRIATSDISMSTRQLSLHDDRSPPAPTNITASGELPPLQIGSPRSESNDKSLPPLRSALGDITHIPTDYSPSQEKDTIHRRGSAIAYHGSPPAHFSRQHAAASSHISPPISPNETHPRNWPSPHSQPGSSPFYYSTVNSLSHRPSTDCSSSATGETPSSTEQSSILTPATSASITDRMSIDGITNPQSGSYVCNFPSCNAPPFQTQYLLNSHANVHSSARPHYCPVQGCPRSEGGKGFKRKNEMIRHGLVHESPGYVCPFCPDREHKYPRPDNLQRHVRVHHEDKDKNDPLLRDVLSQRPDGPSRGRRRRGP